MKKRILIDLTDFQNWRGHFTGIQRVIYEIGSRIYDQDEYIVEGFVYNERKKEFYASSADILSHPSHEEVGLKDDSILVKRRSAKDIAIKTGKKLYTKLPHYAKKLSSKTYHTSRHYAGVILNNTVKPVVQGTKDRITGNMPVPVQFQSTDLVLILGAGWHKRTMPDNLSAKKTDVGFDVHVLIHDVIPIVKPEYFGVGLPEVYGQFMFEMMPIASQVYAISKSTKKDIEYFCGAYNVPLPKVVVIREGDSFVKYESSKKPRELLAEPGTFILAVGTFEVRKNYQVLYQAAKMAQLRGVTLPKIVIVGRKGWLTSDLEYLLKYDMSVKENIVHLHNVSDSELSWLYANTLFTVYPSLYEGWGLPIAESLFYGKFCLSSDTSSMPEVAGDFAEYVNPYNVEGWMEKIAYYGNNPEALKEKQDTIVRYYKPTDWSVPTQAIIDRA